MKITDAAWKKIFVAMTYAGNTVKDIEESKPRWEEELQNIIIPKGVITLNVPLLYVWGFRPDEYRVGDWALPLTSGFVSLSVNPQTGEYY